MKRFFVLPLIFSLLLILPALSSAYEDIREHPSCKYCGMDREKFAFSRMYIKYDDGSSEGTCSLHCTAIELALSIDKTPVSIEVADYNTRNLIDAEKAFWVIGGDRPGVMTKRAKWAFAEKADAEAFMKNNGGTLAGFEEAMKAAYEDMYQDSKMIREKRRMMQKRGVMEHKD